MLTMARCSRHWLAIKVSRGTHCQTIITAVALRRSTLERRTPVPKIPWEKLERMERAGSSSLATAQVALHMAPRHCKRFRVPKQPSRSVAKKEDLDLTPPEEIRARRIRRWVLLGTLAACVIGMAIYFVTPRIAGAIKAWQSRRLAREAFVLIDQKKWTEANAKARDALLLRPTEPEAWRAAARYLFRS